jgi:hypothetical protein
MGLRRDGFGVATTALPLIDVRSVEVGASSVRCWRAVIDVMSRSADGVGARVFAAGINCEDRGAVGRPDEVGAAFTGFHVVRSEPPFVWSLEGSHRFSTYSLVFRVDSIGPSSSSIHAESRARFHGLPGTAYRTAVVGTGGHAFTVGLLLARMKGAAESG